MKKTDALRKIIAVCGFAAFFACPAFAEETATFSEALERLYRVNETVAAADEEVTWKKIEKKAAFGYYFPKLSINAAYAWFDRDLSMKVDVSPLKNSLSGLGGLPAPIGPLISQSLAGFPNSMDQVVQQQNMFTLDATLIWNVFTGGRIIYANKAAALGIKGAEARKAAAVEGLGSSLAEKYFGVRLAQNVVQVKKEVLEAMRDHYNKAVKMEKAGVLAKVERMHAEVALSEAERSYAQALREEKLASSALDSMLNAQETVDPSTPLFIVEAEKIDNLEYFQDQAAYTNPQLKELGIARDLTKVAVKDQESNYYPKVFFFGNAKIYDYQLSSLAPDFALGVGLNFTIFEGLSGYHKVQAAKAAGRAVQLKKIRAEKDIRTLIEQQYITMENARADYKANKASLAFTEEYLRARRKAFQQGMATSLDVVDAELALSGAKMNAILAAYKFDTALAKLLETAGIFGDFETYRAKASAELGL